MKIGGLQKLSLLDYPNHLAAIIFTSGCNFNCPYCHNSDFISLDSNNLDEEDVLNFLKMRQGILDGVVVTGGEPTIHQDLLEFIKKIKEMNYDVKLDTNGSNPELIDKLLKNNLVDYVAMDVKSTFEKYLEIIHKNIKVDNIKKSIEILKNSKVAHEFRLTIVKEFHSVSDILQIIENIGDEEKIYIQNFECSERVRDKNLNSFKKEELIIIQDLVKNKFPNVKVRNL